MPLTEIEAATKRCTPFAVVKLLERDRLDAGIADGSISSNCIGSRCMQWRWRDNPSTKAQPRGYCGMAGQQL